MKRRHFVAGLAALPNVIPLAYAKSDHQQTNTNVLQVFDLRLHKRSPSNTLPSCFVNNDISQAWFESILPHLHQCHALETNTQSSIHVVGETLGDAVFCIKHLAADQGWQISVRDKNNQAIKSEETEQKHIYKWVLSKPNKEVKRYMI